MGKSTIETRRVAERDLLQALQDIRNVAVRADVDRSSLDAATYADRRATQALLDAGYDATAGTLHRIRRQRPTTSAKRSSPQNVVLPDGPEVTAFPDRTVGLHWERHGFGKLFAPAYAARLGRALLRMAAIAQGKVRK